MENINKEIEQTLASLDGIKRAKAPDALYGRVLKELAERREVVAKIIPIRSILRAAAVFGGIVLFNAASLFLMQKPKYTEGGHQPPPQTSKQVLARAFFQNQSLQF